MTEAWGAGALGMAVEGGIVGTAVVLAVLLLRPEPRWSAGLLLLGLLHFLLPPLAEVALVRPVLVVQGGTGGGGADTAAFLSALALLQWAGLGVGILILVRSRAMLRRAVRRGVRVSTGPLHRILREVAEERGVREPRLYLTRGTGPAATGVFRPAVLLPGEVVRTLDPGALRMILVHEVAHIARWDTRVAPLRLLLVSAWWFHPVVWLLARLHRKAAEDAADDGAVGAAGPEAYCRALLAAASVGSAPPVATAVASGLGGHPLGRRFRRLHRPRKASRGRAVAAAAMAAFTLLAVPLGLLAFDTGSGGVETAVLSDVVVRHEIVVRHVVD